MFLKIWKCVIVGQLRRQPLLEEDRSDVLHFQDKASLHGAQSVITSRLFAFEDIVRAGIEI